MSKGWASLACAAAGLMCWGQVQAITLTAFPGDGYGGRLYGQDIIIGTDGGVAEFDTFVNLAGSDLNGGAFGSSAQASAGDALPTGLGIVFTSVLEDSATDLRLIYELTNGSAGALGDLTILVYLDADLAILANGSLDESVSTSGTLAAGQSYEVDDEGFGASPGTSGDSIADNLLVGTLDGVNAFPSASSGPVSMALAFSLGTLAAGEVLDVEFLISEDGDFLGGFSLTQSDPDPLVPDTITFSGQVVRAAPAPGTVWLAAPFLLALVSGLRSGRRDARP